MPIFDPDSIRRQVDKVEREQDDGAQVDVTGNVDGVTTEVAVEKKIGSSFLGSLWARWTARPGRDDAAIGVRGRWSFGRKEK